ncbi:YcgL domain-containing protein [uncultured Porticoccus sp.]|jgi:uncharacterized protein YcgL (UPF0745 family)|uniref:YcgL domain-containing protein n=1 Tax=Porticoccus sp. TaxID=2024853 RepID=UPI000C0FD63F|nr:YcgL domain-containing protein [uncultured Porticoccus sp.]PHS74163.1 MAG: hypothetical protein COB19_07880 [Porticoccus sp.]|tara:strand:+ start:4165 stop:4449 length:285 start_codon:yes stop_codon:yes gene_type:complete
MSKQICKIYRSSKNEAMYLYVDHQEDLDRIPEPLLQRFGKPKLAMTLALSLDKKLARADIAKVLEAIREQGYYLQLPPSPEAYMQELRNKNDKL